MIQPAVHRLCLRCGKIFVPEGIYICHSCEYDILNTEDISLYHGARAVLDMATLKRRAAAWPVMTMMEFLLSLFEEESISFKN